MNDLTRQRQKRKVCVITGSRAEYGLLRGVMQKIRSSGNLELQLIATGSHLSEEFGLTYREIEADGFEIHRKIQILSGADSALAVSQSMGRCLAGVAEALGELRPDLVLVLGDRYEIFAAAQAAMIARIPIAHIAGGDVGSGTYDNLIRHCLTKMAALHFVTHEEARDRVLQLGEHPDRVFCVGSTCVDNIRTVPQLDREALAQSLGIRFGRHNFLVTYHPLTMGDGSGEEELRALLEVLQRALHTTDLTVVFTKANADNGGREVNRILGSFVERNPRSHLFDSLGQARYLSMVKQASLVIGNSSSGIYEAPYLGTPTVDIGLRQAVRKAPASVFRAAGTVSSIQAAVDSALAFRFEGVRMIYGDGSAADGIVNALEEAVGLPGLNTKDFVDLKVSR